MLESISELFLSRKSPAWHASDTRLAIERYLRSQVGSEAVYCVAVQGGKATVRVGSPTLYQEVRTRQWDLEQALAEEIGYTLEGLTIIPAYY